MNQTTIRPAHWGDNMSDEANAAWDEYLSARRALEVFDAEMFPKRDALIAARNSADAKRIYVGKKEGWHV